MKEIKENGYGRWKDKYNYGRRWIIESVFSILKRMNNEVIRSKKIKYVEKEIERLVWVYNKIRVERIKMKEKEKDIIYFIIELADKAN